MLIYLTWPKITSDTSLASTSALFKTSFMTTLPRSDAFRVDKDPQNAPLKQYNYIEVKLLHM